MSPLSFSLFLFAILIIPDLVWWWWADRKVRHVRWARIAVGVFVALMLIQPFVLTFLRSAALRSHEMLPTSYIAAAYMWQFLILPVTVGVLLLGNVATRKVAIASRRGFLVNSLALGPPIATGLSVVIALPRLRELRLRELEVPVPGLPRALDGMVIAHISDPHVGKFTVERSLDRAAELTNSLNADLVLGTGDLIDLSVRDLPQAIDFLRKIDPRGGHFWCEGNHDLIDDGPRFHEEMTAADFPIQRGGMRTVEVRGERVRIVSAPWGTQSRLIAPGGFCILLAHHPHLFDDAVGFPLTLAGHTHGGQLMLNENLGAGPVLFRYWSGLYRKPDRTLVVNNGIGHWFPLRTAAPAEVLKLTLRQDRRAPA